MASAVDVVDGEVRELIRRRGLDPFTDPGRETLIRRTEEAVGYTPVRNAAGCPTMSVPLGRSDGLPVGMHVAGPPGADGVLLALAYELEAAAPWADVGPDTAWLARRT